MMNARRVALGGLLAGVFINVSEAILNAGILMDAYQAKMDEMGIVEPGWAMAGYVGGALVTGFVVAWLYAAIRPRFGPGMATAIRVAIVVWIVGYGVPTIWFGAMGMTVGTGGTTLALVWGFVELVLAALLAGWVYQEEEAAA